MQNSTRNIDFRSDPKYQWFANLRRKCYRENVTHSSILDEQYNGKWLLNNTIFQNNYHYCSKK